MISRRTCNDVSRTCGLSALKVAVPPSNWYFRFFAGDVASRRRCGCTNAPLSDYVKPVVRGLAEGGPKQGGRYGTRDRCPQARGR